MGDIAPASDVGGAQDALQRALAAREANVREDLGNALDLLRAAKSARRGVRNEASPEARSLARRSFLAELAQEIAEVPVVARMGLARSGTALASVRERLFDVTAWGAVLVGTIQLLLGNHPPLPSRRPAVPPLHARPPPGGCW